MKKLLVIIFLIVSCLAFGANHYILDGGSGDGSAWNNAWDDLPGTFTRGDTYYVADGDYGGHTFDTADSGATRITLKKATEASHGTETGWDSAYGDGVAEFTTRWTVETGYWTFDGVVGSERSGHGFKIVSGGDQKLIRMPGGSNVIFQHIELEHRGIETDSGDDAIILGNVDVILIAYCYIHDVGRVPIYLSGTTNVTIEYSHIVRNQSTGEEHSEGIQAIDDGTSPDNLIVRYNVWEDIEGTAIIALEGDDAEIYGNVFFWTGDYAWGLSNGAIAAVSGEEANNTLIYNNSFINLSGPTSLNAGINFTSGTGNAAYNNLWYNCANGGTAITFTNVTHDYNFFDSGTEGEANEQLWGGGSSIFADYDNYDFHLTAATDPGKSDLGAEYNEDMDGVTRGVDSIWDRGAFEYQGGGGSTTLGVMVLQSIFGILSVIVFPFCISMFMNPGEN